MQCARRRSAWHEWELDAEGVWTAAVSEFGEAEEESEGEDAAASDAVQADGSANPAYAVRTTCVSAQKLYERLTGRAMRRDPVSGSGRFEWLQDSEEGIGATERRAACAWLAGGSWRGELRRRRMQEERRAKRVISLYTHAKLGKTAFYLHTDNHYFDCQPSKFLKAIASG